MLFRFQNAVFLYLIAIFSFPIIGQTTNEIDLSQLDAIVANKKYVNLGEDSHFMTEVHKFVSQAFPYLVEKKGFRVFVFESAWGIDDKFRAFMNSDRTTITGEEGFFLNAFNSKNILKMLIWIRNWNRQHPNDKIQIAGYQPEQPVTDFNFLWEFAGKSDKFASSDLKKKAEICRAGTGKFKSDIEFIVENSQRRRKGLPSYSAEDRLGCNQAIDSIENFILQNKRDLRKRNSTNSFLESGAHLKSLRVYLNTLSAIVDEGVLNKTPTLEQQRDWQTRLYEGGDKGRFEIFEVLHRTRYANKKIFFWMHNWHAMKHTPEIEAFGRDEKDASMPSGTISLGTRLAEKYGKELVVIGNIVPKAVCKNPICTPPPVRADSLETKVADRFGNKSVLIDLRAPVTKELKLPIDVPGSLYADINQGTFTNVVLNRQFDAILYIPETTATFEDK